MQIQLGFIKEWRKVQKKINVIDKIQERLFFNKIMKRWDYPTEKIKAIKVKLLKNMEEKSIKYYNIY